jgi:ribonucleoside-diphosphate reductase alpha chain
MSDRFTNSFSHETWEQKYKYKNDSCIDDTWRRVAKDLASVEENKEEWEAKFYTALEDFKFVPGGRITSNAGTGLKGTTYINCFVDGFEGKDVDSIEGIYGTLLKQAQILKSEGGYGFCVDTLRPCGSHIGGIGNQSPGAVKFLELWDKSSEIITSGSGKKARKDQKNFIRKGAQMVTMSCWHPDVIEFIEAKKTPGRLSKFNMSVLCTDEFMGAVKLDMPWKLVFPNYEKYASQYKTDWNGDLDSWTKACGEEDALVTYHEFESARDLWNLIMDNTYNRNEPGVLFVDHMNKMNNLNYCEWINATNPCGEQVLPIGGVCLLGSINLVHFIDAENKSWKYKELKQTIHTAIRFMDNVNDKTQVPLKHQKENLKDKRRIGLGVLGYGSALLMAHVKYGSKKALEMTNELMKFFTNEAYRASALLAKEKGSFPLYDKERYTQGEFIKRLDRSVVNLIKEHGIRNSHITSIQPTGNSSCFANLVSGGLEPLFMHGYVRTSIQPSPPEGLPIPKNIDWSNKTFDLTDIPDNEVDWSWIKEGDEDLLATKFEDKIWKFDRTRGLLKEEWIEDYGVSYLKEINKWSPDAGWAACTMDLNVQAHVDTMSLFANWVDSAISKTINLPNNYPYQDFKNVYKKAWENGIKGFTTYRAGTMTSVLSESSSLDKKSSRPLISDKRPKELPCAVYHITVKSEKYFVLVGMYEDEPYEVFAGKNGFIDKKVKTGIVLKLGRPKGVYKAILEDGLELSPINATCSAEEDALTRMTSLSLRHGADIHTVVQQLEKVKGDMTCFAKSMARALKKYIPDGTEEEGACPECNSDGLIRQEGCVTCTQCGWSKCV